MILISILHSLLRRLKNIGMASEKLYQNTLSHYYYYLEEFHWQSGAQLLKIRKNGAIQFNSFTGLLLVRREVSS